MKKKWSRLLAWALALAVVIPVMAFAEDAPAQDGQPETQTETTETAETQEADPTVTDDAAAPEEGDAQPQALDEPHKPLTAAATAFSFLKPSRNVMIRYYTAIRLPGIEPTVYAFTNKEGDTQFRVYGRAPDAKRGFYEARVTAVVSDREGGWDFTLDVPDTKPVKDKSVFALYKGKNLVKEDVPAGMRKGQGTGMYYFFNLFGKRESMAWASADGENYAWYMANGARPLAGSLELDADAFDGRMHKEEDKYYRIPKELNGGYAKQVIIVTTDGKTAVVYTDKPLIDTGSLKAR